ncbi:MAG TPA: 4Fe-4S binding protein [Myxococcota bacterium]|nr:4Fe-4S binding protein [Myxococcota bacterium]HRY96373.1 4Fe-4S binding protein [Myxococcota bacterium]
MSSRVCYPPGAGEVRERPRPAAERAADFVEAVPGLSAAEARAAAERCLASQTCTFCEVCQLMCPDLCITRDPQGGHILIDLDHCKGCGLCAHFCPKGALEMQVEQGG